MTILYETPVVFTKDEGWFNNLAISMSMEPGTINLLPEDAILVVAQVKNKEIK